MLQSEQIGELMKALAKAQGAYAKVKRDSENKFLHYDYASLASILDAVREAMSSAGIAICQGLGTIEYCDVYQVVKANGRDEGVPQKLPGIRVMAWTQLSCGNEWVRTENWWYTARTDPQALGSLETYARKYQLQAMVGCAPDTGTDDDAESLMIRDNRRDNSGRDRYQGDGGNRGVRPMPATPPAKPATPQTRSSATLPPAPQPKQPAAPAVSPSAPKDPAVEPGVVNASTPAEPASAAAPTNPTAVAEMPVVAEQKAVPVPDGDPAQPGAPAWHSWASRDLIWWITPLVPKQKDEKARVVNALLSPWGLKASELQGIDQKTTDDILFSLKATHERLMTAGSTSEAAIATMVAAAEAAGGAA